nr:gastrula zinc finger protein XlCGF8.2DB-like [Leptinotarsa decemlineata]
MPSLEPQIDEESTKLTVLLKIEKPLICEECGKCFSDHIEFAYHSRKHSDRNVFSCHLCFFTVNSKFRIRRHIKAHSGYRCQVCNKTFKRGRTALNHSYLHSGEKPYRCKICGKQLANPKSLDTHLHTIHHELITGKPLSKYDCPICKKHYESETGLRRHYSSTHREMGVDLTVICEVCGRRISNRTRLTRHMRTHTGQKPFPCSICNKSFATKCLLISHTRIHTGEKPYVCSYCGKRFGHSAPYRYHVKIHTGDRKYVCKLCGKGFISSSNLKIHMKSCYMPVKTEIV